MSLFRKLFGKKQSATPGGEQQPHPASQTTSFPAKTQGSPLRLADPAHPARKLLDQTAKIMDQAVSIELVGDRTALNVSAPPGKMEEALVNLTEAAALCPNDLDLLVARASVLHAYAQFKFAEHELDVVLSRDPEHFEAKMWKTHWETWSNALRYPGWDEHQTTLHTVMAAHLRHEHRVQVVRDGMQKALAIVASVQGPPFDSRTQIKVEWILSETPYGPMVAYYLVLLEPSAQPSKMEAFLPIFEPTAFSPLEGYLLVQQLAFTPYCFVVLVSGSTVTMNRKVVFAQPAIQKIRTITSRLESMHTYLPQQQFKNAVQWHMNNFDMDRMVFK